jgi:predicted flavoprotein YhiN
MTKLHITPYNQEHAGFYVNSFEDYEQKIKNAPFEEYEIQFIDGDDSQLFNALNIDASTIKMWFDEIEDFEVSTLIRTAEL